MKVSKAYIIVIKPIGMNHPHGHDTCPEGCCVKFHFHKIIDGDPMMNGACGKIDPLIDPCTL